MIGLVVVTHGALAKELIAAMEHVVGPQEHVEAVCIGPDDDMEDRGRDIVAAAKKVDQGDGVLIMADMFGGTPANLSIAATEKLNGEVVAGVSLPMLIKFAEVRADAGLAASAREARDAGRRYAIIASDVLEGRAG